MPQCSVTERIRNNDKRLRDIRVHWNSHKNLIEQFGYSGGDILSTNKTNEIKNAADKQLKYMEYEVLRKDWSDNIEISDADVVRMKRTINRLNKEFNKKTSMNSVYQMTQVPSMVHSLLPSSKIWLNKTNRAIAQERVWRERFSGQTTEIANRLKAALIDVERAEGGVAGKILKKMPTIEMVRKMEAKIESTEDDVLRDKYYREMVETLKKTEGGRQLLDYHELVQAGTVEAQNIILNRDKGRVVGTKGDIKPPINDNVQLAYETTKELLGTSTAIKKDGKWVTKGEKLTGLADVLVKGLESSKRSAEELYTSTNTTADSPVNADRQKELQKFNDNVDIQINSIKNAARNGSYFPHKIFDMISKIRASVEHQEVAKNNTENLARLKEINKLLSETSLKGAQVGTTSTKGRYDILESMWSRDPLTSLEMNINEALTFNRNSFIKEFYVDSIREMGKDPRANENTSEFMRGMRNYMEMQYKRSTEGFKDRPSWLNNATRTITGVQVMTTMGFGVLGAARNYLSGYYFHASQGMSTIKIAQRELRSNKYLIGTDKEPGLLAKYEDQGGFKFKEAGIELAAEGLAPLEGLNINKIDWVMDGKGKMHLQYDGKKPTGEIADRLFSKAIQTSLVFHRFGENKLRRNIWRIAFADAFYSRQTDKVWHGDKGFTKDKQNEAAEFAARIAQDAVNTFAFEYSIVNKAPIISGTAPSLTKDGMPQMSAKDYAAGAGSVIFQFMHYPMSFAMHQAKALRGTIDGAASGQGINNPDSRNLLGVAGVFLAVRGLSVATNSDLRRLMPNDTLERMEQIYRSMTKRKDNKQQFGILSQFTGPTVNRALFWANYAGIMSTPDSAIENAIFGYEQYSRLSGKDEKSLAKWNQFGVELSRLKHKTIPNLRRGSGIPTLLQQEFSIYPTEYTKEWRKGINRGSAKLTGKRPFQMKKPKPKRKSRVGKPSSLMANKSLLDLGSLITTQRAKR